MWTVFQDCGTSLAEGATCTVECDPKKKEEVVGHWTCIRAQMWGKPTCNPVEAKYWMVSWILPKIVGSFDFYGSLWRWVNMTNSTVAAFEKNVSKCLAGILENVEDGHFEVIEVDHLWESQDEYDAETGMLLEDSYFRSHLFSVNYELLIWDVNTRAVNLDRMITLLRPGSTAYDEFGGALSAMTNVTLQDLWVTNFPISFNMTVLAPDREISRGARQCIDVRLLFLLVPVLNLLAHLLSDHPREGQG